MLISNIKKHFPHQRNPTVITLSNNMPHMNANSNNTYKVVGSKTKSSVANVHIITIAIVIQACKNDLSHFLDV